MTAYHCRHVIKIDRQYPRIAEQQDAFWGTDCPHALTTPTHVTLAAAEPGVVNQARFCVLRAPVIPLSCDENRGHILFVVFRTGFRRL